MRICVVGLGYVGVTLGATMADLGFQVTGFDTNKKLVSELQKGDTNIEEPELKAVLKKQINSNLAIKDCLERNPKNEAYLISVGTPIDENKKPVLSHIIEASKAVGRVLCKGQLVVLRSTVTVGTTRKIVLPILESESGLRRGSDFSLVFAPERTAEGVAMQELRELPQIIGGLDSQSVEKASAIFREITQSIVTVSSVEAAELAKLLDNTYRDVNIALGNEIGMFCEKAGLDAYEVASAVNRGYKRTKMMRPGAGVGGACLPKDPYLLISSARELNLELPLVALSRNINEEMPNYVFRRIIEALGRADTKIGDAKIFLLGIAFKGMPQTMDTRNSQAISLYNLLIRTGADIVCYDPVIPLKDLQSLKIKTATLEAGFDAANCAVFMNDHPSFSSIDMRRIARSMKNPKLVVDGWKVVNGAVAEDAGLQYVCIGNGHV